MLNSDADGRFKKSAGTTRIHRRHRISRKRTAGAVELVRFLSPTPIPVLNHLRLRSPARNFFCPLLNLGPAVAPPRGFSALLTFGLSSWWPPT
eukprot:4053222-Pleurochrysis_carterae.AAC.1